MKSSFPSADVAGALGVSDRTFCVQGERYREGPWIIKLSQHDIR